MGNGDEVAIAKALGGTSSGIIPKGDIHVSGRSVNSPIRVRNNGIVIIEAVNNTGVDLTAFQCVALANGVTVLSLPKINFPSTLDNSELIQYGSLMEDTLSGQIGHVQISGAGYFQVFKTGASLVKVGEIIYPLDNVATKSGFVSNKASADVALIKTIPIGRSCVQQASDTDLIQVNISGPGGSATSDIEIVTGITTASVTFSDPANPSGIPSGAVDGTLLWAVMAGRNVLLKNQTQQNGVWTVSAGAWTKIGTPKLVIGVQGTLNANSMYYLSPTINNYAPITEFYA